MGGGPETGMALLSWHPLVILQVGKSFEEPGIICTIYGRSLCYSSLPLVHRACALDPEVQSICDAVMLLVAIM